MDRPARDRGAGPDGTPSLPLTPDRRGGLSRYGSARSHPGSAAQASVQSGLEPTPLGRSPVDGADRDAARSRPASRPPAFPPSCTDRQAGGRDVSQPRPGPARIPTYRPDQRRRHHRGPPGPLRPFPLADKTGGDGGANPRRPQRACGGRTMPPHGFARRPSAHIRASTSCGPSPPEARTNKFPFF